jgi:hypothetical protein
MATMLGHETFPASKNMRKTPQGVRQAHAREGMRHTVFSHPDFLAAITGCQPSAPALDRIC